MASVLVKVAYDMVPRRHKRVGKKTRPAFDQRRLKWARNAAIRLPASEIWWKSQHHERAPGRVWRAAPFCRESEEQL